MSLDPVAGEQTNGRRGLEKCEKEWGNFEFGIGMWSKTQNDDTGLGLQQNARVFVADIRDQGRAI